MENPNIISIARKDDRKIINVKSKSGMRPLTVPINAPEIDPYDKQTGRGFMTPNAIIQSGLSTNAKLMFSVLRSFICYGLGVVFPNEGQIEQAMSKERKANRKALKELVQCGVICVVKMPWQGHLKNYYYLEPEDKWNLPESMKFSYSKNSKEKEEEESGDSEIKEMDNIASRNSIKEEFIADESLETMIDIFEFYSE